MSHTIRNVLVTGGAGFIGLHLCQELLRHGYRVRVLDNLSEQVHGVCPPAFPLADVEFIKGDVRDSDAVRGAIRGMESVVHLAAETGTGQSMCLIGKYQDVNVGGAAILMESIAAQFPRTVESVVLASSRAVYGEGAYRCDYHGLVFPEARKHDDLSKLNFEPRCPVCGRFCVSRKTPESAPHKPTSLYGLTKQAQEQLVLMMGTALGLETTALRLQNVYGPGQSLSNPYTGILAIFSGLARAGSAIDIFEDGLESRDFVYVADVVEAICLTIAADSLPHQVYNVGSGIRRSVYEVAQTIRDSFHSDSELQITGKYRVGDIRHCFADTKRAQDELGFMSTWSFARGVTEFVSWAEGRLPHVSRFAESMQELRAAGMLVEAPVVPLEGVTVL